MAAREGRVFAVVHSLSCFCASGWLCTSETRGSSNWTLAYKEEKANMKLGERLGEVGVRKSGVDTVKLHCGSV